MLTSAEIARLRKVHHDCDNARPRCPHSELLDAAERMAEAREVVVTPGSWTVVPQEERGNGVHRWWWEIHVFEPNGVGSTCIAQVLDEDDAALIAEAPVLKAENEKLREMVDYVITLFERMPDATDAELADWIARARASIADA